MPSLKVWAVAAGVLVDSIGTLLVSVLYLVVVLGPQVTSGTATAQMVSPTHMMIVDGLGMLLSGLGGFVAGRLAKTDETHHGAATGFGSLVVWILLEWSAQAGGPRSWRDIMLSLAVVPVAALGGYIAGRLNARAARQPV